MSMDTNKIVEEWFYRLPKGYALAPYTDEELKVLNEVLDENGLSLNEDVDVLDQAFLDAKPVKDLDENLDEELLEANKFLTEAEENGSINDLYSLANEQDKGDDFEKFIAKLPAGLPKAATIKHLLNLSQSDKQKFMKNGWEESTIPNTFTISDKFEIGLFNIDAKGIGKGEVYCCWRFRDSEIEGGTSSFDVTVGNTTYEVKDYSGPAAKDGKPEKENKKSIRVGKEGIVSKFPVWKTILRTVDMVKRIPEDKYELLPGASPDSPLHDKWQQLIKLRNYIVDRVSPKNLKIVTGEFNTTDTKSFKQFYFTLNELLTSLGDQEEFNQLVAYGPNQKPLSLVIDPISLQNISKKGELTIKVQNSGYDARPETLINYLKRLPYVSSKADPARGPVQFEKDLQTAVSSIISAGEADNWLVYRGTASNIIGRVISKDRAGEFRYAAISQGGIKFYEPQEAPTEES